MQILNKLLISFGCIFLHAQSTCVIAIKCADGIAIGSDSQSPSGGSLIGNRETQKIFELSENVVLCSAAGGRDVYKLQQDIQHEIRMHKLHYDSILSVSAIATFSRQLIHNKYPSAHVIIAGILNNDYEHDTDGNNTNNIKDSNTSSCHNSDTATNECKIYEIVPGGSLFEQEYAIAGSAASHLYPMLQGLCQTTVPSTIKSQNNSDKNKITDNSFDPFKIQKVSNKSFVLSSTETAFSTLHILLQSAVTLDPKSGGQQCKWLLPLLSSKVIGDEKRRRNGGLTKIQRRSDLIISKTK